MRKKTEITAERVGQLLRYERATGSFVWIARIRGVKIGEVAGSVGPLGYRRITIDGESEYAHRLVWFLETGQWPVNQIDHLNGNRDDNRIENLRDVTVSHNSHNTDKLGPKNSTGARGVARYLDKFIAQVSIDGRGHAIALCDTIEEAAIARKQWDLDHGYGAPTNINTPRYPKSIGRQARDPVLNPKNQTGFVGVCKKGNRFMAKTGPRGAQVYLGLFDTAEEASQAVQEHRNKLLSEPAPSTSGVH